LGGGPPLKKRGCTSSIGTCYVGGGEWTGKKLLGGLGEKKRENVHLSKGQKRQGSKRAPNLQLEGGGWPFRIGNTATKGFSALGE